MQIEFELVNKEHVNVIAVHKGERKKVGEIFTPADSGHDVRNAIQVCGFAEAYDLWGCANFGTWKTDPSGTCYAKREPKTFSLPYETLEAFDPDLREKLVDTIHQANRRIEREESGRIPVHLKDIQLMFPYPEESFKMETGNLDKICWGCYNMLENCSCENKGKHKNPYDVKRASDLKLLRGKEDVPPQAEVTKKP